MARPGTGADRPAANGRTVSQIVFRFTLEVSMIPLTGTTDAGHMREDLEVFDFCLEPEEVERADRAAEPGVKCCTYEGCRGIWRSRRPWRVPGR